MVQWAKYTTTEWCRWENTRDRWTGVIIHTRHCQLSQWTRNVSRPFDWLVRIFTGVSIPARTMLLVFSTQLTALRNSKEHRPNWLAVIVAQRKQYMMTKCMLDVGIPFKEMFRKETLEETIVAAKFDRISIPFQAEHINIFPNKATINPPREALPASIRTSYFRRGLY